MNYQQRTPPSCVRVVYIAGDTLRHQPMGAGHMTVPVMQAYWIPYPALVLYIAGDALRQQPMGSRSHDCSSYVGCGEFRALQWCHPMLACIEDNKLWHPDDHLIWCSKVDSGPRSQNKACISRAVQILAGLCTFLPQINKFGKSPPLAGHVTSQKLLDQSEPFETKETHANEVNRTTWSGNQNNHSEARSN